RELLRVEKEKEITDQSENITWERTTRAYMSDGTVLAKHDVRFKPNSLYGGTGEFYSWGWKVFGKIKADRTPEQAVANISAKMTANTESKWRIISGGPAPVILSEKRIIAAIESGDSRGFCKACGAEAYNV